MEKTKVVIDNKGNGVVQLFENDTQAGKMNIAITEDRLTVQYTESLFPLIAVLKRCKK